MPDQAHTKILNPLSIIFLFFSFTEVVLGYAVFNTVGGIQIALTIFVIAFPSLAACAFFLFLWHRPQHLYAPKDYGSDESYLRSMADARQDRSDLASLEGKLEDLVSSKLTSGDLVTRLTAATRDEVIDLLSATATDLTASIRNEQFLTIHFAGPANGQPTVSVPVDAFPTVSELIDYVYDQIRDRVEPYQYGFDWVLRDDSTGDLIRNIRMLNGTPPGKPLLDNRPLADAGVRAGMSLTVISPPTPNPSAA